MQMPNSGSRPVKTLIITAMAAHLAPTSTVFSSTPLHAISLAVLIGSSLFAPRWARLRHYMQIESPTEYLLNTASEMGSAHQNQIVMPML
jgi:hypothetical protein